MRSRILNVLWLLVLLMWPIYTAQATLTPSGPIVINGQNGTVITGLKITNPNGDCVRITNSTNITIKESEIGPCMGRGIYISGGSGHHIYDNYIHVENQASGCCDTRDGILMINGADTIDIQGNVIAFGESNIEMQGGDINDISIIGNYSLNPRGKAGDPYPRGHHIQSWGSPGTNNTIVVRNNYVSCISGQTYAQGCTDMINFGFTNGITVENNYLLGTGSVLYESGCGIIADQAAINGTYANNILSDVGHCGIGIAAGTNHDINGNKILILNPPDVNAVALSVYNFYAPAACNGIQIRNTIAALQRTDLSFNSYWNGGNCGTVILTNNTLNQAAYDFLYPMKTTNPPPLIPPEPKNCVTASPYSTQTSRPACDPGSSAAPAPPTNLRVVEQP